MTIEANTTPNSHRVPRLGPDVLLAFGGLSLAELAHSPVLKALGIAAATLAEIDLVYHGRNIHSDNPGQQGPNPVE